MEVDFLLPSLVGAGELWGKGSVSGKVGGAGCGDSPTVRDSQISRSLCGSRLSPRPSLQLSTHTHIHTLGTKEAYRRSGACEWATVRC